MVKGVVEVSQKNISHRATNRDVGSNKNASTLLTNDLTPRLYKERHRSALMKAPDMSVKTLDREYNSGFVFI